jgi:hypothetical protein
VIDPQAFVDPTWWTQRFPGLHVEGEEVYAEIDLSPAQREAVLAGIHGEGWFHLEGVLTLDELKPLLGGIVRLRQLGLSPVFIHVFDETWAVYRKLGPVFSAAIDGPWTFMPAFWAWYLDPLKGDAGWTPHRDREDDRVMEDHKPVTMSLWIPLTPALPENGCMYVVPYPLTMEHLGEGGAQHLRALPANPGSILGWHQQMYHWGGKTLPTARFPRVSLSIEVQRSDREWIDEHVLDPWPALPLRRRLSLIAAQILRYSHMFGEDHPDVALARLLLPMGY